MALAFVLARFASRLRKNLMLHASKDHSAQPLRLSKGSKEYSPSPVYMFK